MGYRSRNLVTALWITACFSGIGLSAQKPTDNPKAVLVELFTSEGCSSCPPADALLRRLNGTQTSAGQLIVGLSEHVTYWNSLGWKDPFSSQTYTDRQNAYGARFRLDSVYTPQMVINGREQVVGSDKAGVLRALQTESQHAVTVAIHIFSVNIADGTVTIHFSASGGAGAKGADILAAIAEDTAESDVSRGENSGRTLQHVAVTLSIKKIATVQGEEQQTGEILLPTNFRSLQKPCHLVLFAQEPGYGHVLGIDTHPM